MSRAAALVLAAIAATAVSAKAATHPPDGLVVFVNASSASVAVSVDGGFLCAIAPGSRCTTVLTGDVAAQHTVSAASGGNNWSDSIKISECHANYLGTKTFTFRDDSVPFSCEKQEASAPPPAVAANPPAAKPVAAKSATVSDLTACKNYSPDSKARIAACTRIIDAKNPGIADLVTAYHARCGTRFLSGDNVDDALADCTRAVTLDPKSFDAFHVRGVMNSLAGRLDAAIADLTQAIALNPKYLITYGNRAEAYLRKKDLKMALADYAAERDLIADPKGAEATYRVHLCWARGALNVDLEAALGDCDSAVRLEPSAYSYRMRALVRMRMGNLKDARADIEKALTLESKNASVLYLRGILNAREGKTKAANDDIAAAKKMFPMVEKEYSAIGLMSAVEAPKPEAGIVK